MFLCYIIVDKSTLDAIFERLKMKTNKTQKVKKTPASVEAEGYTFTRKGSRILVEQDYGRGPETETILSLKIVRDLASKAEEGAGLQEKINELEGRKYDILDTFSYEGSYTVGVNENLDGSVDFGCTTFSAADVKKVADLAK